MTEYQVFHSIKRLAVAAGSSNEPVIEESEANKNDPVKSVMSVFSSG